MNSMELSNNISGSGVGSVLVGSKYPSIHYSTAPNPNPNHLILSCHPQHPLLRLNSPVPFTCMGCKEYGSGNRFTCQICCDYQLHDFCALPPTGTTLNTHPLHPHHPLRFSSKPAGKGGILGKRCYICNKAMAGYTFGCTCSGCGFQMHPSCAMLSTEMSLPMAHHHTLILMPAAVSTGHDHPSIGGGGGFKSFKCGECSSSIKKRSGRLYRCTAPGCNYHLHAVCAKNMVNGLRGNGSSVCVPIEKPPSMLGVFSKFASLIVLEFVGGLIGGLGNTVGDVLGQTIAAPKGITRMD